MAKDSIIFYKSWGKQLFRMSDHQIAEFMKGLIAHSNGEVYEVDDQVVEFILIPAFDILDANGRKYQEKVRRMEEARKTRDKNPDNTNEQGTDSNLLNSRQETDSNLLNNSSDTVTGNDTVTVIDTVTVRGNETVPPPTLEEIKNFFREQNYKSDPVAFYEDKSKWRTFPDQWKKWAEEWERGHKPTNRISAAMQQDYDMKALTMAARAHRREDAQYE